MTPAEDDFSVPAPHECSSDGAHEAARVYDFSSETPAARVDKHDNTLAQRIHISTPEEMLAYIQCTLGFQPSDSLVIVAFAERQLSTVIRCDLPEPLQKMLQADTLESVTFLDFGLTEAQELQLLDLGKHLGQLIARDTSTTGCLLVYLPAQVQVSDQHALAASGTVNAMLTAQLGIQRVPVEESWLIHHDQLWHLRCAVTMDCAVQGQALGHPETTDIFRTLDPDGTTRQRSQKADRTLVFPQISNTTSPEPPDTQSLLEQRPKVVLNWLQRWEERLSTGPAMLHTDQVAELLSALEHPQLRDTVLGIACFDYTTAVRGMMALGKFSAEIGELAGLQSNVQDGLALKGCLTGRSDRAPDWQRIAALERLCRQLLPLSNLHSGGVVAGLLVWIEWVRGRGSLALDYLRQARKHFPTERFLVMFENVLRQGLVAEWATRTSCAWSPRHAA